MRQILLLETQYGCRPRRWWDAFICLVAGCWLFFFFIPSIILALPSPSLPVVVLIVPQIQGHIAGPPPPSPLRYVSSVFIARRVQYFLPSSTRVESVLLFYIVSCLPVFLLVYVFPIFFFPRLLQMACDLVRNEEE